MFHWTATDCATVLLPFLQSGVARRSRLIDPEAQGRREEQRSRRRRALVLRGQKHGWLRNRTPSSRAWILKGLRLDFPWRIECRMSNVICKRHEPCQKFLQRLRGKPRVRERSKRRGGHAWENVFQKSSLWTYWWSRQWEVTVQHRQCKKKIL